MKRDLAIIVVLAELGLVVLAFGLGLTWAVRREQRRRALAAA